MLSKTKRALLLLTALFYTDIPAILPHAMVSPNQGSIWGETRGGSELDFCLNQRGSVETMGLTNPQEG